MFSFLMCHRQCRKRGPRKHHYGVGSYEISEESSSRRWSHWSLYRERCFVHVFLSYFVLLFVSFFGLLIFLKVILVIEFLSVTLSSPFPSSVFFVFQLWLNILRLKILNCGIAPTITKHFTHSFSETWFGFGMRYAPSNNEMSSWTLTPGYGDPLVG